MGIGSLSFQPTEFVKIALIIFLAVLITRMGASVNTWKNMVRVMGFALPIAGIVAANNLSSGIIIAGIAFCDAVCGLQKQWPFYACGGLALLTVVASWSPGNFSREDQAVKAVSVKPYPCMAFSGKLPDGWWLPGASGTLRHRLRRPFGKGLGESIQKMGFVPEAQNDMIFSIICEELGLFGAVSVILIFLFMIYRFMLIANNAPDLLGALIVVGVMAHIAIQVILNIAVVTNTIPNTGITLPFISYGGTSVLFLMMEMGMVWGFQPDPAGAVKVIATRAKNVIPDGKS